MAFAACHRTSTATQSSNKPSWGMMKEHAARGAAQRTASELVQRRREVPRKLVAAFDVLARDRMVELHAPRMKELAVELRGWHEDSPFPYKGTLPTSG